MFKQKKDTVVSQNATFGTTYGFAKKGISPVVSTALLLVVAVVALVGFQGWYQSFSSNLFADVEQDSGSLETYGIESIIGDNLYLKAGNNLTVESIRIDGNDCNINGSFSGTQEINVSICLNNVTSSTPEIVMVTDDKVLSKSVYFDNTKIVESAPPESSGPTIIETDGNFNLFSNGIVTCNGAAVGDDGILNGTNFTAVSNQNLSDKIGSNDEPYYETACTSLVTDMNTVDFYNGGIFYNANINPDISHWDTSNVTDMSYMFQGADSFNQPLYFDTSSVTNMRRMFYSADIFNQPLNFDTSSVVDMEKMFLDAVSINSSLNFNTSNVINMSGMFVNVASFNQPLNFDTSSVEDMSYMFEGTSDFNQLLNFNTSSVTNMEGFFYYNSNYNQPLNFDTSNVTNMEGMFRSASSFDQNLTSWCVTNIDTEPNNFATSSPLDSNGLKPDWGTCP